VWSPVPICRSERLRSVVRVREEVRERVVYIGGTLVRVHRAEVAQLVAVAALDQLPLNLRQTPLMLCEYTFAISSTHLADTTSRQPGAHVRDATTADPRSQDHAGSGIMRAW
jgi:hypothetical protein